MRRNEHETTDKTIIEEIIAKADVIRLGLFDGNEPYIVPLNFGYKRKGERFTFYMHCANEGRKIDIIKSSPNVCFEIDTEHKLVQADMACGWTMQFKSVMGIGTVEIISDKKEKVNGLTQIMLQYDKNGNAEAYDFSKLLDRTTILKLTAETISCKVKS